MGRGERSGTVSTSTELLRQELMWLRAELKRAQVGQALWRHLMRRVGQAEEELERRANGESFRPPPTY
jgi:hypothetical protein